MVRLFAGRGYHSAAVLSALSELRPKALLYSAGGNDVAGDEFGGYLNHKSSGLSLLRPDVMAYLIDTAFERYFRRLIEAVADASPNTTIVIHGYGHTQPTGRGVVNVFGFHFLGPWLLPALRTKGILNQAEQLSCVFGVIDRYNAMLERLSLEEPRFRYVDLRPLIDPNQDWANELHLRNSAFRRVAGAIAQVLGTL